MSSERLATQMLRIAMRRAARGTGSSPAFLRTRTAMQALPDLKAILHPVPWVLVGGIALRAYTPERMTQDIDILVHSSDDLVVRQAFQQAGYYVTGTLTIGGFSVQSALPHEMPIDVLTRSDRWVRHALAHPSFDPAGYPVLGRAYLILIKLQAGRSQDVADIQRLLFGVTQADRQAIGRLIVSENPEFVEDYDSLCTLADLEFGAAPEV